MSALTHSTRQAMALLNLTKAEQIAWGKYIAGVHAWHHGTVTSRDVREALFDAGVIDGTEKEFWLGAIFRGDYFEWTGKWATYSDASRNIHERTIKVWRLADVRKRPPRPKP